MPRRKSGPTVDRDVLAQIENHRKSLPARGGERRPYIEAQAERLGLSASQLYRQLQEFRGARVKRAPKTKQVPREDIEAVLRVKRRGLHLGDVARELATEDAIEIAEAEGLIEPGSVSVTTADRRRREVEGDAARVRTRLHSPFPNHLWQVDFSPSKYLAIVDYDDDRGDYVLETSAKRLAYKENNRRRMLWLAQAKDAHSKLRVARGFVASGESALLGIEFVDGVIRRADDGNPMRGIPHHLKIDNGPFKSSTVYDSFIDALGITDVPTAPMNSASQGLIENAWRHTWKRWELYLVARYGERWRVHLADYNALLAEHLAEKDATKPHTDRPGLSRAEVYRSGLRSHPLRLLPEGETAAAHTFRPQVRTADDALRVRLDNVYYACPRRVDGAPVQPGDRVRVCVNLEGRAVGVLVDRHAKPFPLEPWEATPYGEFVAAPKTPRETSIEAAREEAREMKRANTARNRQSAKEREQGGPSAPIVTLPARTETVAPASPFAEAAPAPATDGTMSETDARLYLGRKLLDLELGTYADWADLLGPHITGGTTREALDRVLSVLSQAAPPATPRRRTA